MQDGPYEKGPVVGSHWQETAPTSGESEQAKFISRWDQAIATIVLTVNPSLLYLIGNLEDPVKI